MKFDVMLAGVGGEGVLTAGVIIARAAHLEGHYVRGVQLHGLAQRGGSVPTFVRFGSQDDVLSPGVMQADADLVLAFEPLEAVRAAYYARREKTAFVIDDYPYMPISANLLDLPYPNIREILRRVKPFARQVYVYSSHLLAKQEFESMVLGNTTLLGVALGAKLLPLKERSLRAAIASVSPRKPERNLQAFDEGLEFGREAHSADELVYPRDSFWWSRVCKP
jgi:indolepyruvate ferredoxin oxidoreductase beta subunit